MMLKRFIVANIILLCVFSMHAQVTVSGVFLGIGNYFNTDECIYLNIKYSLFEAGSNYSSEVQYMTVAKQSSNIYNSLEGMEYLKVGDKTLFINHETKTARLSKNYENNDYMTNFTTFSNADSALKRCSEKYIEKVSATEEKVVVSNCMNEFVKTEVVYKKKNFEPILINLYRISADGNSTEKIEIRYENIQKLKTDKDSFLDISKYLVINGENITLNEEALQGYSFQNAYN